MRNKWRRAPPTRRRHTHNQLPLLACFTSTATPRSTPQRYIVRIIFMIPVYSIASFPSLLAPENSIYWVTVRDWCALECCSFGVLLFALCVAISIGITAIQPVGQWGWPWLVYATGW